MSTVTTEPTAPGRTLLPPDPRLRWLAVAVVVVSGLAAWGLQAAVGPRAAAAAGVVCFIAIVASFSPNLRAVNFVLHGYLGEGVAASSAFDPQAKGLGEYFRSRRVPA